MSNERDDLTVVLGPGVLRDAARLDAIDRESQGTTDRERLRQLDLDRRQVLDVLARELRAAIDEARHALVAGRSR